MKQLLKYLGVLFMGSGMIFLLIHSFIVTGTEGEPFARDLFGFPIPHPPLWTSYIPYLGSLLDYTFQFFSIHGLIGIIISIFLFGMGGIFIQLGDKNNISSTAEKGGAE